MTIEPLRVDIISDVVCPWCIVGYRQLALASEQSGVPIEVFWHPFELNPDMGPDGENLRDHIMRKYGSSEDQSRAARARLKQTGADLGITFAWTDDSRIYNTFPAHQVLHWASLTNRSQDLKLELFHAYFTEGKDISQQSVLADVCEAVGLNRADVISVLECKEYAAIVRDNERFWTSRGVTGVPTMIFGSKFATSGAQGIDGFYRALKQAVAKPDAHV